MGEAERMLGEIEAGLEGVTPGPWTCAFADGEAWLEGMDMPIAMITAAPMSKREEADLAHLMAMSPDNWRVILAHIATLTAERDEARARAEKQRRKAAEANIARELAEAKVVGLTLSRDEARTLNATVREQALEEAAQLADATVEYSGSRCVEDVLQEGAANARAEGIADAIRALSHPTPYKGK